MTLRGWRLAFAMQRLELLVLLGAGVVLVAASLLIAWQTTEVRAAFVACMDRLGPGGDCSPTSPSLNDFSMWGGFAKMFAFLTPFALGLFLGVPIVAREVEGRTAPIAWTLSTSRLRWLVLRAAPVVVFVVVVAALVGIGGEAVTRANPFVDWVDPGVVDLDSRGALLPVRALAVLLLAIAMGAMVPRQLPAFLLAGVASLVLFTGLTLGMDAWMRAESEPISPDVAEHHGARVFDFGLQNEATGEVVTLSEYYDRYGFPEEGEQEGVGQSDFPAGFTGVVFGVPGEDYGPWALRESAVLGALAVVSATLAVAVVRRRRPG